MYFLRFSVFFSILFTCFAFGQESKDVEVPKDWHLLEVEDNYIPGISLKDAYEFLKFNKLKPNKVIVAVLDSGLDIQHEDIAPVLWVNEGEIPDNGIDDDGNGYIDDINGWNFIGGANNKSVEVATLESTRLYKQYKKQFENKNKFNIRQDEKDDFLQYVNLKRIYEEGIKDIKYSLEVSQDGIEFLEDFVPHLQEALGKEIFTEEELKKAKLEEEELKNKRERFFGVVKRNNFLTTEKLLENYNKIKQKMNELETRLKYNYSLEFDSRKIIGDKPFDLTERFYGNNDVSVRADHGTHIAGIIAAKRNNGIGVDGIADNVRIMPIRTTPMGDEYDKDVANGIRYAVDNGAKIINMSFGKEFSPQKQVVDEAIKYASEKGVLFVHAAGNDNLNIDFTYNYPSPLLLDGTIVPNWIEVGATSFDISEMLVADFSNYGKASIDIFAPGVDIYSTIPGNLYDIRSGTSMATPVVSGVAALLFSYFPELTILEIRNIIIESGESFDTKVYVPGTEKKVDFSTLSKSGKIINAYRAVRRALEKKESLKQ